MSLGVLVGLIGTLLVADPALADTLTVTVASGSGHGSLPAALLAAQPGDTIDFNLNDGGPATIALPQTLVLTTPDVTIVGSDSGQQPPASPLITLRPASGMSGSGIAIQASGDTIQDVSVTGFSGSGIELDSATRTTLDSSTETPSVISGNSGYGILVNGSATGDNRFAGYRIQSNGRGPFSVSGPALEASAVMDSTGTNATVTVTGASPGEPVSLQAGDDPGCTGSFIPYAGNTATATTDASGDATLSVSVAPAVHAPDGVRIIVSGQNDGTVPVGGCVVASLAPTATIASPSGAGTYAVGQVVATRFACAEGLGGPGIHSCTDSLGAGAPSGRLDTSRPGAHVYTVTAISSDGRAASTSLGYTVAAGPTIRLAGPSARGYVMGARVRVRFRCTDGAFGPGIARCLGTLPSGRRLATDRAGRYRFTVVAISRDGQRTTLTVRYRIRSPAAPGRG